MRRQTSLLCLGIFAATAGAQVAACSSDDSSAQPGGDAGSDVGQPSEDTGTSVPVPGCSGPLPVMTVPNPAGGQMAPDWSCYAAGANSYARIYVGDDGGGDADSDAGDAGVDANVPIDAGTDAAPAPDASTPPDAGTNNYRLHIIDFSSGVPPVGSSVEIFWGKSTQVASAFTGTVDDAGIVFFPTPPAGTAYLSFDLLPSTVQEPVYWQGQPIIPPGFNAPNLGDGQTEANSVSATTRETLLTSVFGSESPAPGLSVLVTAAIDCNGASVQGAQFTLIDGATGQSVALGTDTGDPRAFYFINDIPNSRCTYTNNIAKGVWSIANAPVNEPGTTHPYTLRMSGRMDADAGADGDTIAETPVELYPDGITLALARSLNGPPPNVPDGG